MTADR